MASIRDENPKNIPIKNIWILHLWASGWLFGNIDSEKWLNVIRTPYGIPFMVAEMLCNHMETRINNLTLSYDYSTKSGDLAVARGKINCCKTIKEKLYLKGKIACNFNVMTLNIPRNQFAMFALEKFLSNLTNNVFKYKLNKRQKKIIKRCKFLIERLIELGILGEQVLAEEVSINQFTAGDYEDMKMVSLANLLINLRIPDEESGRSLLYKLNDIEFRDLYERAIVGFYKIFLPKGWKVTKGSKVEANGNNNDCQLKSTTINMKTDAIIENSDKNRIILDTKFKKITHINKFGNEIFHNKDIFQITSYLVYMRDSEEISNNATGLLLYPSFDGSEVMNYISVPQTKMRCVLATVDLNTNVEEIQKRLLYIIEIICN